MNKQIPSKKNSVRSWTRLVLVCLCISACSLAVIVQAAEPAKGLNLSADLSVSVVSSPPVPEVNGDVTYTLSVSNAGPLPAVGVIITDTLPLSVDIISTNGCTVIAGVVTCNLGTLAAGSTAVRSITIRPLLPGVLVNVASVTALTLDLNLVNNLVTNLLNVLPVNIPPVAVCKPINVELTTNCQAIVTAAEMDNGSFDLDGSITNRSLSPPGPYSVGVTLVTLMVTDNRGATASCIGAVTVLDVSLPVISCLTNLIRTVDANQCSSIVTYALPQVSDNCLGSLLVNCAPPSGSAFPVGTTTVDCIARDIATNTSLCSFTVTVLDTLKPTITCPSDITTNASFGGNNRAVSYAVAAADSCSSATVVCVPPSGSLFAVGDTPVLCVATDNAGNTNGCSFNVKVASSPTNIPPTARCQELTTNVTANCQAIVSAEAVDNGSSDDDGAIASRTLHPPGPYPLGTNEVILTIVDNSGASNSCAARIIVVDVMPPVLTCPPDITAVAEPGATSANVEFETPSAEDACTANVVCAPPSNSSFELGTTLVTCTATDSLGNTNSCNFAVNVQETDAGVHDLAVRKIRAPRILNISGTGALTKRVCVTIQNRGAHIEVITNYAQLANLVTLQVRSLDTNSCSDLKPVLIETRPQKKMPVTLKPKRTLKVFFDVAFECTVNPAKGPGMEDFEYTAAVHHEALNGLPDSHPECDVCPRGPQPGKRDPNPNGRILDKGCGAPMGGGFFGNPVVTDVFIR